MYITTGINNVNNDNSQNIFEIEAIKISNLSIYFQLPKKQLVTLPNHSDSQIHDNDKINQKAIINNKICIIKWSIFELKKLFINWFNLSNKLYLLSLGSIIVLFIKSN